MNFGYKEQAIYDSFITLETLFSENPMRSLLAKRSIDKKSTWQCMITLCMYMHLLGQVNKRNTYQNSPCPV